MLNTFYFNLSVMAGTVVKGLSLTAATRVHYPACEMVM